MREEQYTHVWNLENTHIYGLEEGGTNENTKTYKKNIILAKKKNQEGEPDQAVQHTKQLSEDFGDWTFHILEESQNVEQVMAQ